MPMVRRRMGFTLIELLVVIAIIAILAAILFPVFMRAKARAHLNTCAGNLKQWNMAMLQYMGDNNDRFPYAGTNSYWAHPVGQIGGSLTFYSAMWKGKYVRNKAILWCPLWLGSDMTAQRAQVGWTYYYFCPHGGNTWVSGENHGKAALCGYRLGEIRTPSKKPSLTEIWSRHESETSSRNGNDTNRPCLYPVAYCDGHVAVSVFGRQADDVTKYLYVGRDGSANE